MTNAYYPFNRSGAIDVWGSNDGTVNGATYLPEGGPRGDGAYDFNGSGNYIGVSMNDDPFSNGNITVSCWVNPDNPGNSQDFVSRHGSGTSQWKIGYSGGGQLQSFISSSGSVYTINLSTNLTPQNLWTHTSFTFDGSDHVLYVNGVERGRTSVNQAMDSSSANIRIGRRLDDTFSFDGGIDDVRLYDRALDPWEIHELFQYGTLGRDMRHFTAQAVV